LTWFVPHILICEIRFLGENVYALLNKLTAMEAVNRNHIPIIVTSTCATGTIEQIPEIEFERYLLKPIDLDKLVVAIKNLVPFSRNNLRTYAFMSKLAITPNLTSRKALTIPCGREVTLTT